MADRLFRFAGSVCVTAVAVVVATTLIERVLLELIAVLAVSGAIGATIVIIRYRRSRW